MQKFTFVILGFTGNLTQLKIIPALYDLENKKLFSKTTAIIGVGRQGVDLASYVLKSLTSFNKDHLHEINQNVVDRLVSRIKYLKYDFGDKKLYKELQNVSGNILYYLATYPNLYRPILKSIKDNNLNKSSRGWVRLMVEKPIGNNLKSAKLMNKLFRSDFSENQIYRVDHYLGKYSIRKLFNQKNSAKNILKIEIKVLEKSGVGMRGKYYDATGALIDMGQSHMMQMIAAVCSKSHKPQDRLEVLKSLVPITDSLLFGQYDGYLDDINTNLGSNTDTYFKIKTYLKRGKWKNIPIYLESGKNLNKTLAEISIFYNDDKITNYLISPLTTMPSYDPYEKLIYEAVCGNQMFFNTEKEIEASWKFIDKITSLNKKIFIYPIGSDPSIFSLKNNS